MTMPPRHATIDSPTRIRTKHQLIFGLFGGVLTFGGTAGVLTRLTGQVPATWMGVAFYAAWLLLGLATIGVAFARRRTVVDPDRDELRVESTVGQVAFWSQSLPLEPITAVSLHPEMNMDEDIRGFTRHEEPMFEDGDRCTIDVEIGEQMHEIETSPDNEAARRRAERLAAALDVTLYDSVTGGPPQTPPEDLDPPA
jgi:hypothetical protein